MPGIQELLQLLQTHPAIAAAAYVALYAGVMLLGLPGGLAMLLVGGYAFGNATATVLALTGAALAAAATYPVARGPLGRFIVNRGGEQTLARMATFVRRQGIPGLLLVRMIPLFPFALLNVCLSLIQVPFLRYLITTVAGTVPIAVLVTRVGSETQSLVALEGSVGPGLLLQPRLLMPLGGLLGVVIAGLLIKKRMDRKADWDAAKRSVGN
ncbi:MAG: VTT domain-containing protein [Pseudomonadota bacterium]